MERRGENTLSSGKFAIPAEQLQLVKVMVMMIMMIMVIMVIMMNTRPRCRASASTWRSTPGCAP